MKIIEKNTGYASLFCSMMILLGAIVFSLIIMIDDANIIEAKHSTDTPTSTPTPTPTPTPNTWPNCSWNCNANDITVEEIWLGNASGAKLTSCNAGETATVYIWAKINNNANDDRRAPRLIYNLYVNNNYQGFFDICITEEIRKKTTQNYQLASLNWMCGDSVELKNVVLSFLTTNNASCSDIPTCSSRQSHCKQDNLILCPVPTPSPTPTPTSTPTPTLTPTPTATPEPTPTPSESPSPSPTETPEPTETPSESPSPSPSESPEPTPTVTPEPTPTPSESPSPSPTETPEPTETPSESPTPTPISGGGGGGGVMYYSVLVNKAGDGNGTVTSGDGGIVCGDDCSETYGWGSTITLTATPGEFAEFTGWSGDCSGETSNVCTLTINGIKSVTANFSPKKEVLGEATCAMYLFEYIKYGANNNPEEVKKLQTFLNMNMGANLAVTGIYDWETMEWVKKFQLKYKEEILKPWVEAGLHPSEDIPTGYVYKTTKRWINMLMCPDLNLPPADLSGEQVGFVGVPREVAGVSTTAEEQVAVQTTPLAENKASTQEETALPDIGLNNEETNTSFWSFLLANLSAAIKTPWVLILILIVVAVIIIAVMRKKRSK